MWALLEVIGLSTRNMIVIKEMGGISQERNGVRKR